MTVTSSTQYYRLGRLGMQALPELADAFAFLFMGASSWLLVSAVFAAAVWETQEAPESYALFAHLDVAVEVANVLPAVLVLFTREGWPSEHSELLCALLLTLGVADASWLALASSLRSEHASLGMLIGAAGSGLVGTTAMVSFFPFAAARRGRSSIAQLSAGVGCSGLIAQVFAAASHGGTAFGSRTYFCVVGAWQLAGALAFGYLLATRRGREEAADSPRCCHELQLRALSSSSAGYPTDGLRQSPLSEGVAGAAMGGVQGLVRSWVRRHQRGMALAGHASLLGVALSCVLEFAMPGLLPFLCAAGDKSALFWLTALWNVMSIVGRLAASVRVLTWFAPSNGVQALILGGAIACATIEWVPPLALSLASVASFSALHGLVVTSAFVSAGKHGHEGTVYAGLANQAGALLGSLLTMLLVSTGLVVKK